MLSTNSYAENFAEKFPSVSLNQSWDYSTGGFVLKSGTRAGENVSIQSISGLDFGVFDNKPTENTNIFNTVATTLPDYEKHEGQPVVLVAPSSSFYIFPISAQGQRAIVRALGGTIDIELQIGSTTWKKSSKFNVKEMLNTSDIDYNKKLDEFTVTGWNPDANNVSVRVEEASGNVYTVEFPKSGSAPMIIAKDINKKWQGERQSVTAAWFSK